MGVARYQEYRMSSYFRTELPAHWEMKKLSLVADEHRYGFVDGPFGSDLKSNEYQDSGVPLIQLNNIRDGHHVLRNMKFITEEKKLELNRHIALPNDVVIAKMAEPVARAAIVSDQYNEYVIVADCVKLTPDLTKVDLSFLVWVINSDAVRINAELVSTGTTRIRINLSELKKLKIPYPAISEQTQIANFLDHETAKIDTLIDKQQQLIKLLKEKRQAVISHAVTKGLDPDATMKDSGVEWLGEVPEHWEKIQVKRLFKFAKRQGYEDLTVLSVYRDHGVIVKSSRDDNFNKTPENLSTYQLVNEGDLVINKMKAWQGSMGISAFRGITSPDYAVYRPLHKSKDFYLHFWFRATHMPEVYRNLSTGIRPSQWRLDLEEFEKLNVFVPPQEERTAIVDEIKVVEGKYLKLIELAETQIALLSERRTALISAAVTGKIDVRNWNLVQAKIPMEASA
jgi:type I restriction enzyme S subunit